MPVEKRSGLVRGVQGKGREERGGKWRGGEGRGGERRGEEGREGTLRTSLPFHCPLSTSPLPQAPGSLGLQTDHKALLGDDFLLVKVSESLGLLLQPLPQHRIVLK